MLNIAQAATIGRYERREMSVEATQHPDDAHESAEEHEIEGLYETFSD